MALLPGQGPMKKLRLDETNRPAHYVGGIGRGAKIPMSTRGELGLRASAPPKRGTDAMFGNAPPGYVPGRGRGATGFIGGVSRDEVDRDDDKADLGDSNYDEFSGYGGSLFSNVDYDEEDKEADVVYDRVDAKMDDRRRKQREKKMREQIKELRAEKPTIQQQFADMKRELATVSNEEWEGIPEAQEHLKVKQRKPTNFTPTPDALLAGMVSGQTRSLGGLATPLGGLGSPLGMRTPMGLRTPAGLRSTGLQSSLGQAGTPLSGFGTPMGIGLGMATPMGMGLHTPMGMATPMSYARSPMGSMGGTPMGMRTPMGLGTPMGSLGTPMGMRTPMGTRSVGMMTPAGTPMTPFGVASGSLNDLGEARGTVLAVKLDRIMDSVTGQTVMDPKGYLTDLNALQVQSDADISDIKKARTLLKSVITSNPKHGPGWIAAARLEEVAGKVQSARQLIAQGCSHCPNNEDVWLEAARLEKPQNAKAVLAKAVKALPHSVRLWIDAANREQDLPSKARVLRKALEFIPNSVRLWKEAVDLEDRTEARVMLSRAVECVPHSVEMWLALAKLSTYLEAKTVLNDARKHIPTSPVIWVTAAKLEEMQGNDKMVELILTRAIDSLAANGVTPDRDMWLKHAEEAEKTSYIKTCQAIVKVTIKVGVDEDVKGMKQNWIQDADAAVNRSSIEVARAIYNNAVLHLKNKKKLWLRLAELETKYGASESLDNVLQRAVTHCPQSEILWLMAAKQKWLRGDVASARRILAEAFGHSKESEAIHLAAVKLESENNEIQRSRLLLARARQQCNTPKVWMQSVQLEREQGLYQQALHLCEEGLRAHPSFAKMWMIGGQIHTERAPPELPEATAFFKRGAHRCPRSARLWLCAVDCEIRQQKYTMARSLLERGRHNNPGADLLWLKGVEVEMLDGNESLAHHMMSRALQECPTSGALWAKAVELEPKQGQNAKSVDALKKCENDAHVIIAVAKLFWRDQKNAKARKWFNRAVTLNPRLGDAWGAYLAFEMEYGTAHEQREVIRKCVDAEPNQGIEWNRIVKRVVNWRAKWAVKLKRFVEEIYPAEFAAKPINKEVELLLQGEDPYTAMAAVAEKDAAG